MTHVDNIQLMKIAALARGLSSTAGKAFKGFTSTAGKTPVIKNTIQLKNYVKSPSPDSLHAFARREIKPLPKPTSLPETMPPGSFRISTYDDLLRYLSQK